MTTQLIPVFEGTISNEPTLLVNARDLHGFLEVGKDFSNWIRARLNEYGFVENLDYILFSQFGENSRPPPQGLPPHPRHSQRTGDG